MIRLLSLLSDWLKEEGEPSAGEDMPASSLKRTTSPPCREEVSNSAASDET